MQLDWALERLQFSGWIPKIAVTGFGTIGPLCILDNALKMDDQYSIDLLLQKCWTFALIPSGKI